MKRILIAGANSFVGTSFERYINENYPESYGIETIDMIDSKWKNDSFFGFDTVFYVAGIVHIKETKENRHLYYEVNRDLAIKVAEKAKAECVKQFIYLSSMSVYGITNGKITRNTVPNPKTAYGISKLEGEEGIISLSDESFKVSVVRPPMIYGLNCKGNFQTVVKIVDKVSFFPKVENKRSMIHIDNLCSFISKLIDFELSGYFFPQNKAYMNTSQMAQWISEKKEKSFNLSVILGAGIKILQPFNKTIQKAFGSLVYENLEDFNFDYCVVGLEDSVKKSIG